MATKQIVNNNSLSQIEAIFFDLDNTLIQTRKADAKACNKTSSQGNPKKNSLKVTRGKKRKHWKVRNIISRFRLLGAGRSHPKITLGRILCKHQPPVGITKAFSRYCAEFRDSGKISVKIHVKEKVGGKERISVK
ncbi:HAD-like superfamily [Sergentomyia squamirostris]